MTVALEVLIPFLNLHHLYCIYFSPRLEYNGMGFSKNSVEA